MKERHRLEQFNSRFLTMHQKVLQTAQVSAFLHARLLLNQCFQAQLQALPLICLNRLRYIGHLLVFFFSD